MHSVAVIVLALGSLLVFLLKSLGHKRLLISAAIAATAGFLYKLTGGVSAIGFFKGAFIAIPQLRLTGSYAVNAVINILFSHLEEAAMIVLALIFVYGLCHLPDKRIRTGVGAKIWFGFVVLFNIAMVIVSLTATQNRDILAVFLTISALTGLIILWSGRRIGWYVYLLPICLSIALNYKLSLNTANLGNPNYLTALSAFIFILNPLITWLVIRNSWKNQPSPVSL
ncbi:MAG: hypothetical protein LBB49_05165 [Gracilibacteraceae bacterium]|nr:hypothetical protein [Gracilibacteraceae bacterium]